jgi:hypothetical protein
MSKKEKELPKVIQVNEVVDELLASNANLDQLQVDLAEAREEFRSANTARDYAEQDHQNLAAKLVLKAQRELTPDEMTGVMGAPDQATIQNAVQMRVMDMPEFQHSNDKLRNATEVATRTDIRQANLISEMQIEFAKQKGWVALLGVLDGKG